MEFGQKLQELRKSRGITQEELAQSLYVSRTAISKWESGRGYPNIDSLRAISKFFSVTVDELLSTDEVLSLAEEENKQKTEKMRDLVYGLLDICSILLIFLPFFASRAGDDVQSVSLIALNGVRIYIKIAYFVLIGLLACVGVATLALRNCQESLWLNVKTKLSLGIGTILTVFFMISLQPYAAPFAFALLVTKALMLIKWQ